MPATAGHGTASAGAVRAGAVAPRSRSGAWVAAGFGALLGAVVSWAASDGLIDDTYITLAYARNLADSGHWGLTPQMTSNAATSPLNVLLLAVFTVLVRPVGGGPVLALGVLTAVLGALAGWWLQRVAVRLGLSAGWPVLALVVVLLNPFLVSALGLEVVLVFTCVTGLLAAGVAGRSVLFGVAAGAGLLARLDVVVFVVVLALACAGVRRRLPVAVLACVVVAVPWFAVSWWWLGSAIPDTFVIKTLQESFGEGRTYLRGLWTHYAPVTPVSVVVAVAPALVGLVVLGLLVVGVLRRRVRAGAGALVGLGLGGVGYFAVYSGLGVPPYQWYYVPPLVASSVVAVLGAGVLLGRRARRPRVRGALVGAGVAAVVALGVCVPAVAWPLPWAYPPVFGNYATPAEYRRIGADLGVLVGDERVSAAGEIGTLAYSCRCEVVDAFSDPAVLQPLVERRIAEAGPVLGPLLELNYARREVGAPRPVPFALRWTDPGSAPAGLPSWSTTAGTWRAPGELVLRPARG
ncbi:hypothetical protein MO973_16130 [Paenibacillus sp. TRM 82003]|uniref:hypothetical protein n=1 Tax=Kineococcus sp. TRM81007 TaxID=2925831 RepID=UPI001F566F6B|nr:hypothetical protein [Kineococcus sp. TRM81007]MCI2237741.1 hypothetical protein [Kineococcus sp. TRM81007]MCI3921759.1 hypothetical protein [Paenibacillus sp. TRM 82003]